MTRYLIPILLLWATIITAQDTTIILNGTVQDSSLMEAVPFANIVVLKDNEQIAGTTTDLDGNYEFRNLPEGTYNLRVSYVGLPNLLIENVKIITGITKKDIWFPKYDSKLIPSVRVSGGSPIIELNTTGGRTYSAEEISTFPVR